MRTLYHPDGNHFVWGIKCKFRSFDFDEIEDALKDGWFMSPMDFESSDNDGDGDLDYDEAKAYAAKHGVDIEGLHWKKAVKKVQEHINGN